MNEENFKRRRWLFWLLIIVFIILNLFVWSDVFKACDAIEKTTPNVQGIFSDNL